MAGIRFLILSLLCLVYVESSSDAKDRMEIVMGNLQKAIREVARKKAEENERNEMTSKLLDAAKSLTDENKLEIFEEYLQEAVDQANRRKAEDRDRFVDMSSQFKKQAKTIYPALQLLKTESVDSGTQDFINTLERVFKKLTTYVDLKTQGFSGTEEYNEKTLREILKVVNIQQGVPFEL